MIAHLCFARMNEGIIPVNAMFVITQLAHKKTPFEPKGALLQIHFCEIVA